MTVGMAPQSGWIIEWETIREIAPEEAQALLDALNDNPIDEFCRHFTDDDWSDLLPEDDNGEGTERIRAAWDALADAVKRNTSVNDSDGLEIEADYYDKDNGDSYDEFENSQGFFYVCNAVTFTPAAQQYADRIRHALWTKFG